MARKFSDGTLVNLSAKASYSIRNQYQIDTVFRVTGFKTGYNYNVGQYLLVPIDNFGNDGVEISTDTGNIKLATNQMIPTTVEVLTAKAEKLCTRILALEEERKGVQDQIEFLTDNDLTVLDQTQFKAFSILKLIDRDGLTDIEKSRLIADLIKV